MAETHLPKSEKRRAARVPAELLVMIEGFDTEYRLARGNISCTGVLLELPASPGVAGDLELLHFATPDRERRVAIMGQLLRTASVETPDGEPRVAVVFQFLPERPEVQRALIGLIEHIVHHQRPNPDFAIDHRVPVQVSHREAEPRAATVFRLAVKGMQLETTWPVNLGDRVMVAFHTSGTRLPFEGRVIRVTPREGTAPPSTYTVDVAMGELGQRVRRASFEPPPNSESIDLLLSELIATETAASEPPQRHLAGRLERIALTSLLTFLEMERQSGRLAVSDRERTTLFIDQGQVIDIEPVSEDPRRQLERLLARKSGRFAFTCEPIERPDRLQQSTTHILLDWARRQDEGTI